MPIVNDNGVPTTVDVVNGVQLLFWDGASAKEVMNVSADQIAAAVTNFTGAKSTTATTSSMNTTLNTNSSAVTTNSTSNANINTNKLTTVNDGNSIVISKENGYSLNYSKDGYLWITTPANYEGKVYTFSWQKDF